jgi:hypothetical protein
MNTSGMAVTGEILLSDTKSNILSQIYNYDEPDLEKVTIIAIPELSVTEGVEAAELVIEVDHADLDYFLEDFTYVSSRLKLTSSGETYLGGEVRLIGEMEIIK